MTNATLTRHLNAARKTLTVHPSARAAAIVAALATMPASAAWELGRYNEVEAVEAQLRAELAFINECAEIKRTLFVPAKVTGFAAEIQMASALNELSRR